MKIVNILIIDKIDITRLSWSITMRRLLPLATALSSLLSLSSLSLSFCPFSVPSFYPFYFSSMDPS